VRPRLANTCTTKSETICAFFLSEDFAAISVGCSECRAELERDRFNKIDYVFQRQRLKVLYEKVGVTGVLPERNSIGIPLIEQLSREGFVVMQGEDGKQGFNMTASTKPQLIENLSLTFEREEWKLQPDALWTAELEAYEGTVSSRTGRSSYSAPVGLHDDTVIARALMIWAGGKKTWLWKGEGR